MFSRRILHFQVLKSLKNTLEARKLQKKIRDLDEHIEHMDFILDYHHVIGVVK